MPLAAVRQSGVVLDTVRATRLASARRRASSLLDDLQSALRRAGEVLLVLDNFEHVRRGRLTRARAAGRRASAESTGHQSRSTRARGRAVVQRAAAGVRDTGDAAFDRRAHQLSSHRALHAARARRPSRTSSWTPRPRRRSSPCARVWTGCRWRSSSPPRESDLFSPSALLDRIAQRAPLLTGGLAGRPPHQQTLRATLAWSYDLLDPAEQHLFAQLGVFAGAFVADAADAVCSLPDDSGQGVATRAQQARCIQPVARDRPGGRRGSVRNAGDRWRVRLRASGGDERRGRRPAPPRRVLPVAGRDRR